MNGIVFKIVTRPQWQEAERLGVYTGAPIDLADGYVHLSTAGQVRETAARHFGGSPDLLLVALREDALAENLKYEPSRGGALFPHLYGPLPLNAVVWVKPLPTGPDGIHVFPELFA